ncbi:MAG: DNA-protecting protein DprA [Ilumatobacter sp.]|uniref:DNA-processing protein DprA n=1 Tax=Ilumatobacter sp. TaxID=1967498 RepID=UPI001DCE61B4|nr:DNA-protecting protein DprA [Ilumatobacter sp.]MBT5864553.1 DNA-protecting protein DprA [Ilumatobacter sp.]MBT7430105.1 DNA-protecting protein DprA [Ilumatobacter sp.]MDG0977946.1 DNA-processing protein DprA [Ilumatobacter sp.]MDG1391779.1 DNA-processing protein DprA [Ilumatobacter sp.]
MSSDVPDAGYLAALAGFDRMTVGRLRHLVRGRPAPEAYGMAAGTHRPSPAIAAVFAKDCTLAEAWRQSAQRRDPRECWEASVAAGVRVLTPADPSVPPQLSTDPACPAVLFVRGNLGALDARRVGIVGTRNATQAGRATAARFGCELAEAGVVVLSGLARGIDAAAHRGALSCPTATPAAVVGCGLDRPYPKQNSDLWDAIAARGVLISEWPVGTSPDPFRFPLRNRILAALVEVLVVVESRDRGGSLITVREAADRSIDVMAVPGSVHSRASEGTNKLLADGAIAATETADVLMALGLDHRRAGRARFDARTPLAGVDADVYAACRESPRTIDAIMLLTGAAIGEAAMLLARLEGAGWLIETGGWFEAVDEWAELA